MEPILRELLNRINNHIAETGTQPAAVYLGHADYTAVLRAEMISSYVNTRELDRRKLTIFGYKLIEVCLENHVGIGFDKGAK